MKSIKIKLKNIVRNISESLINLRNPINCKKIPEKENLKKIFNVAEKILDFNKQQTGKRLLLDSAKHIKILTAKQML